MLIAADDNGFPKVGKVVAIPPNVSLESRLQIQWMVQERAPHKSKWLRSFKLGPRQGEMEVTKVLLYDFQLTNNGCLKKKSRDYLKSLS